MAATVISALVIGGAWRLLTQLDDVRGAMTVRRAGDDAAANGLRLLRALVARATAGPRESQRFSGSHVLAHFSSWCETPGGWLEACAISLAVSTADDTSDVMLLVGDRASLRLWRAHGPMEFRYVDSPTHDHWNDRWEAGITAPAAVAVVTRRDTLLLRVGVSP